MDFLRDLVDAFIPSAENGYKPNFFRTKAVLFTAFLILILAAGVFTVERAMLRNQPSLAAVITAVLINLTNADRSSNGLPQLALNPTLTAAAQAKADDMAAKGYFAHTSPGGVTPWYWFKQAGYTFEYAGENLAVHFSDSIDVERAWMNSPAHRANILNSNFSEIGMGIASGQYKGESVVFVVQMFGRPAPAGTAPVVISTSTAPLPAATSTKSVSPISNAVAGSKVAGTSTEDVSPRVIVQDDTFIAVKNPAAAYPVLATTAPVHVSAFATLFTSPTTVVGVIYLLLGFLVFVALVIMVVVEIRHQHVWNVVFGVLLLVLMSGLFYAFQTYFPGQLLVL